jgi:hypothetical protein
MPGAISEFSISNQGKAVLVATNPDPDIENTAHRYLLSRYSTQGKLEWKVPLATSVKGLDFSDDATLAVVATYDNEILAFSPSGKMLWKVEGICKPIILNEARKILCYHDDDAEPHTAFDVMDWSGKVLFSYPIKEDILALKVSSDQKHIVLALIHGQVSLIDFNFQSRWMRKVDGEVIDVSVSSAENPQVAVLYRSHGQQKISVFNSKGELLGSAAPSFLSTQVEISPLGQSVFYYGNSAKGQFLGQINPVTFQEDWKFGESFPTDYSGSIFVSAKRVFMGFEEVTPATRRSRLSAFEPNGSLKWSLILPANEGAYLYGHRVSIAHSLIAVATDDGKLNLYRMAEKN